MANEYFIGIDLGGTNVEIGLLDHQGAIAARMTEPTQIELGPNSLVERVAARSRELINKSKIPENNSRRNCIRYGWYS